MKKNARIFVVGAGWAGEKHIANLRELGYLNIVAVDSSHDRLGEMYSKFRVIQRDEFRYSFDELKPSVVFVCVPTHRHIEVALEAAGVGAHIFMEKPLSHDLEGIDELLAMIKQKHLVLYVNYNMKFQPSLQKVKELLNSGVIGDVVYYHAECGQHLNIGSGTSWLGDEEKGGGVLLETSHEIDYTRWLLGDIKGITAFVSTVSLPITSDDCSDLLFKFESGAQGHIHLDFLQPFYRRKFLITGTKGVIEWDYKSHPSWEETFQEVRVRLLDKPGQPEEIYTYRKSKFRNDIFKQALEHFFRCIEGKELPFTSLEDAKKTLEVVVAAKRSSAFNQDLKTVREFEIKCR